MAIPSLPARLSPDWYGYAQGLDSAARNAVPATGDSTIAGVKTFTADTVFNRAVITRGYSGEGTDGIRIPFNNFPTIDGSKLGPTNLSDKVGMQNSVTFVGGFTNEASYGASNPGFIWGANDFVISGTTSGDLAGVTDMWGRLIEVHAQAPGTNLGTLKGLQVEGHLEPAATGGHVDTFLGIHVLAPRNGGTINTAIGLQVDSPATATDNIAFRITGDARAEFTGDIHMNLDPSKPKVLHAYAGEVRSRKVSIGGGLVTTLGGVNVASVAMLTAESNADGDVVAHIRGRATQSVDILQIGHVGYGQPPVRVSKAGIFVQSYPVAIADAELNNNEMAMWIDGSAGAMKLMLKGRDNGGTIRTGSVALS